MQIRRKYSERSVTIELGVDNIWDSSPLVNTETTSLNGFRDRTAIFQESVAQDPVYCLVW